MTDDRLHYQFLFGLMMFATIGASGKASAATNSADMPTAANFTGNDVQLVVADPYATSGLNAPLSRVKIYSTTRDVTLTIYGKNHCNNSPDNDTNTFSTTRYKYFTTNSSEAQGTSTNITSSTETCSTYTLDKGYNVTLTNGVISGVPGHQKWYVYIFEANITGDGVNGFKLHVGGRGNYIGYSNDSTDKFGLQNRTGSTSSSTFNIPFAADCSVNGVTPTTTTLYWSDDDWGGIQSNRAAFYFRVKDVTSNTYVDITEPGPPLSQRDGTNTVPTTKYYPHGGGNASQTVSIAFNPDHKFVWEWYGVEDKNGIQFHLPYDSIAYNTLCWDLSGKTTASATTVSPGGTVTFTHTLDNLGPGSAYNFAYTVHYRNLKPNGTVAGSGTIDSLSDTTGTTDLNTTKTITKTDDFSVPSTWLIGSKRCEYIDYDPTKSPIDVSPTNGQSTEVCVTVADNKPVGKITMSCSGLSVTVKATFRDPNGATDGYIKVAGIARSTQNSPATWSGEASGASVALFVKDVPATTYVQVDSSTTPSCSGPTTCPKGNQNTKPSVNLPDAPVPNPNPLTGTTGTTAQTGSTKKPGEQYAQEVPGDFQIDAAHDEYTPSTSVDTTSKPGVRQATNKFDLDYKNYVKDYPYDTHTTTIDYRQYYKQTLYYTSSVPDYYVCDPSPDTGPAAPNDANRHPMTCTHTYTGTAIGWKCTSPDTGGGSSITCTKTTTTTTTVAANRSGTTYSCPANSAGTTYTGPDAAHNCTKKTTTTSTYNGTPNKWSCNAGDTGGNTVSTCKHTYTGVAYYNWHTGANKEVNSKATYTGSPVLEECYDRQFSTNNASPTAATAPTYDSEDPYSASFQGTAGVTFSRNPSATVVEQLTHVLRIAQVLPIPVQMLPITVRKRPLLPAPITALPISGAAMLAILAETLSAHASTPTQALLTTTGTPAPIKKLTRRLPTLGRLCSKSVMTDSFLRITHRLRLPLRQPMIVKTPTLQASKALRV